MPFVVGLELVAGDEEGCTVIVGTDGTVQHFHVCLFRRPARFMAVTGDTGADYVFPGIGNKALATILAGMIGTLILFGVAYALAWLIVLGKKPSG